MRQKDESKIEAIYQATLRLVLERGVAGITMCDISKEASLGTGTLYIYFKNKEELIKALFAECREESVKHYFRNSDAALEIREQIKRIFVNIIRYKTTHFQVSVFMEQSHHSPFVCTNDLNKKEKALQPLFQLVRTGMTNKLIRDMDAQVVISFLFGIINEWVKKAYFSGRKITPAQIDELFTMFWNGIRSFETAA